MDGSKSSRDDKRLLLASKPPTTSRYSRLGSAVAKVTAASGAGPEAGSRFGKSIATAMSPNMRRRARTHCRLLSGESSATYARSGAVQSSLINATQLLSVKRLSDLSSAGLIQKGATDGDMAARMPRAECDEELDAFFTRTCAVSTDRAFSTHAQ